MIVNKYDKYTRIKSQLKIFELHVVHFLGCRRSRLAAWVLYIMVLEGVQVKASRPTGGPGATGPLRAVKAHLCPSVLPGKHTGKNNYASL